MWLCKAIHPSIFHLPSSIFHLPSSIFHQTLAYPYQPLVPHLSLSLLTKLCPLLTLCSFLPNNPPMAAFTLAPTTPSQLCSSKNGVFSPSQGVMTKASKTQMVNNRGERGMKIVCQAGSIPADRVPDMGKRQTMNLLLLGAISLPTTAMLLPYTYFFVPPGSGGGGGGTPAKDALGNDVIAAEWLKTHGPGDRTLTQGLKGDPTYLVVESDKTLATYGINAVCTHLGCVVPFNKAENKFMCPCHGSQYNNQGTVIRGPAPLSLALAHADIDDGKVIFVPWTETDFRTGDEPWWR